MNEFNYYLLYSSGIPNSPAVELDEDENDIDFRWTTEELNFDDIVKMKFVEPYPKKPEMTDFHQDGVVSCFSQKIYDILYPLSIKGIQLFRFIVKCQQ